MNTKEQLEAQVKELENKLSEIKATINEMKEEKKSFKRWRADKGGVYFYIASDLSILKENDTLDLIDIDRYNYGNYYKTKEEAERARDLQLAIVRVNDAIDEMNEGWVADYSCNDNKFIICYSYINDEYIIDEYCNFNYGYKLKECKTQEIAERIISEHSEDLNLIFNVK